MGLSGQSGPETAGRRQADRVAGQHRVYRQLNDIKIGTRTGTWTPLMKAVVDKLDDADMIAIAAYLVSKGP